MRSDRPILSKTTRGRWGLLVASVLAAFTCVVPAPQPAGAQAAPKPYGSGNLGAWTTDAWGLPAYRYTPPCGAGCESSRDAIHQLGNDGVNALAHGNGSVELFTARTFPRYANKWDDWAKSYSGGWGWVRDGSETWSTLAPDRPAAASYALTFGMGYVRKQAAHKGLSLDQHVLTPSGRDEVLLEKLTFTNATAATKDVRYFDYWDVGWWLPRMSGSFWEDARVVTSYDAGRATVKATSTRAAGNLGVPSQQDDPAPKVSFVSFLNATIDGYDTQQSSLFGWGGRKLPDRVGAGQLGNSRDAWGWTANADATLTTQENLRLAPGESRTLYVLYGIADRGTENAVIDAYRASHTGRLDAMAKRWKDAVPTVTTPTDPWIARELAWNHYYLRSGVLREDFQKVSTSNQGSIYLYEWGQNIAMRDPLQQALALLYTDPVAARDTITYVLRSMQSDGKIPYGNAGYGARSPLGDEPSETWYEPSDLSLWALWAVSEYVQVTRDHAFLDQVLAYTNGQTATVYQMLVRTYSYLRDSIGKGAHGLVKLKGGDWNDVIVAHAANPTATKASGESTLNTALALSIYPRFEQVASRRGDTVTVQSLRGEASALRTAMLQQWRGDHFNRAWVVGSSNQPVEVGSSNVWLEANAAALWVDGLLTPAQLTAMVGRVDRDLAAPSPLGAAIQGAPLDPQYTGNIGLRGTWYYMNHLLVGGLARRAPASAAAATLAWSEFRKNTLANHAQLHPDIWYGTWSGPDSYYNSLHDPSSAGTTWMWAYPVANMHAHADALYSSVQLAGVRADGAGYTIDPAFPFDDFTWDSDVLRVQYSRTAASGNVTARGSETIRLRVALPNGLATASVVRVDSAPVSFTSAGGFVELSLPLVAGRTVAWSVA